MVLVIRKTGKFKELHQPAELIRGMFEAIWGSNPHIAWSTRARTLILLGPSVSYRSNGGPYFGRFHALRVP
jgi:hypothetical protein